MFTHNDHGNAIRDGLAANNGFGANTYNTFMLNSDKNRFCDLKLLSDSLKLQGSGAIWLNFVLIYIK